MPKIESPLPPRPEDEAPEQLREGLQEYAVITLDAEGRILQWSAGAERVFGYSQAEVAGHSFDLVFTPEDRVRGEPAKELGRAARTGRSDDERWHQRKDGTRIWVSGVVRSLRNERGEVTGYSKIARDITTQKLAELQREALLVREQTARVEAERRWKYLEEIGENIPAFVALVRLPDQVYEYANRMFRAGLGNRELIGRKFREVHPEVGEEIFAIFDEVAESGQAYAAAERRVTVADSSERYFDFVYQPMRSDVGQSEAILIFAVEVTDRVGARQASERSAAELQAESERLKKEIGERQRAERLAAERLATVEEQAALLDLAHDAILALRMDGAVEFWNRGAEELYGWTRQEAMGRDVHDLVRTEAARPVAEIKRELESAGEWTGELKQQTRGGQAIEVSSRWVLRRAEGQPAGWLEINRDITEQKRLETHLQEAQKLESLGVLAGGVAHDFNNLLTGIMGNISLALDSVDAGSPVREVLHYSLRASEQAAFLTKQMLAYAGKGQFVVQPADVSQVVRDTLALASSSIPKNARVELALAERLPCVHADVTQLQQVTMNLILNAAEAMGERPGKIVLRTREEAVEESAAPVHFDVGRPGPGRYVVLEVEDSGPGIDPAVRPKIFDPFFSTKFTGRGLGLAALSGIVRMLNGGVTVESVPEAGATFRVYFPAATPQATEGAAKQAPGATVLVVDDEEVVRHTAAAMLRKGGYQVLLAANGAEAVDVFRREGDRVAVILLDMTMPVMGGEEAFRAIKAMRTDVIVMVSSGYSEQEAIRRFGGLGVAGFLQKPYTLKALLDKIGGALEK